MLQSIKNIFSSPSQSSHNNTSKCDTISTTGSVARKKCGNEKDYKEANYFNYFRVLEKTNSNIRNTVGLTSKNYSSTPIFKLVDFTIDSEMNNNSITSVWNQKYTNGSTSPVEGKYQIPLPPYCVVSGFTIQYQDKVFIGKIKSKARAQEKYSDAIASGGQAFIAEKSDNGLFNFQIGNLPPGETVTVSLTIVSEVGNHLSSLHFCLHRFLFPVDQFNFNFNLNIDLTNSIKDIELFKYSNSNTKIEYGQNGDIGKKNKCKLSFSTSTGVTDDVVVIIQPENEFDEKPQQLIEYNQKHNSYAVSLNFLPSFNHISSEDINQKSEFIFVIDCSGSMSGEPIKKAKNALEIIIRSLNENCKFNIYCFGSSWTRAFSKGSKMYNDESLEEVSKYVSKIDANLGGTELLGVMKEILTAEPDFEFPRQVFILTDGEISDRDGMIKFASTHSQDTRIFTYGIGSGVDKELVIGLSKACKGYYEFILDNSDMEEQVMKLVSIAFEPTLSNIRIDWGTSLSVEQGPSKIRPIYSNETLVVYGLVNTPIEQLKETKATIQLIGNGPTGLPISFPVELDFTNQQAIDTKNSSIHTLAAFKVIQDLEESERKGNHKNNQDKIEELGKKFGLVSKYTSYIVTAVSEALVTEETMKTIDIVKPTQLSSDSNSSRSDGIYGGDGGSDDDEEEHDEEEEEQEKSVKQSIRSSGGQSSLRECKVQQSFGDCDEMMLKEDLSDMLCEQSEKLESMECDKKSYSSQKFKKSKPSSSVFSFLSSSSTSSKDTSSYKKKSMKMDYEEEKEKVTKSPTDTGLMGLIKTQKANGSWSVSQFPSVSTSKKPASIDNVDIWITLYIINKITKEYSSQQTQYALVIQKAIKWVKQQLARLNISNEYDNLLQLSY